jgi:uncharacterized repeat protein (TIGR01451 family)
MQLPGWYTVTTQYKDGYATHGAINSNMDPVTLMTTCEKPEDAVDIGLIKSVPICGDNLKDWSEQCDGTAGPKPDGSYPSNTSCTAPGQPNQCTLKCAVGTTPNDPNDFSKWCTPPVATGAVLGDYIWIDADRDGLQDPNEIGVKDIVLDLYACDESVRGLKLNATEDPNMPIGYKETYLGSTTTDTNGKYLFNVDATKFYYVKIRSLPAGYVLTHQFIGGYASANGLINSNFNSVTLASTCEKPELAIDGGIMLATPPSMVSCENVQLNPSTVALNTPISYTCNHKNATSAKFILTKNGTTIKTIDGFVWSFSLTETGNYQWQCVLDGSISDRVIVYDVGSQSINCAVKKHKTNGDQCAVKTVLDPFTPTTFDPSQFLVVPNPILYCTAAQLQDTNYECKAMNPNDQLIAKDPKACMMSFVIGSTEPNLAKLGDRVWYDANKNGIQDDGETGIGGSKVELLSCAASNLNAVLATTTTNANWFYLFDGLQAGSYKVRFSMPAWYDTFTAKTVWGDITKDSNVNVVDGMTDCITLAIGDYRTDIDAWVIAPDVSKSDVQITKSVDRSTFPNKTGELITWTLNYKNNGPSIAKDVVIIDTLPISLQFVWTLTTTNTPFKSIELLPWNKIQWTYSGNMAVNASGSITIQTRYLWWVVNGNSLVNLVQVTTSTLETNYTNNSGSALTVPYGSDSVGSIGNYVWIDQDKDGIQDANEVSLGGVRVELYRITSCAADLSTSLMSTTTNGSWFYLFTWLSAGNYKVKFILANGYEFTMPNQWSDDSVDSDAWLNGVTTCIELKEWESNLTVDAGVYLEQLVSCEGITLSATTINVWWAVNYTCNHKNATSAIVTVTMSGSMTWVVSMTWFTGQFAIGQAGTYHVQCTLDNGISYKALTYSVTGWAISCAYKKNSTTNELCAVKTALDPFASTSLNLSGLIYMPTPYPYCTTEQIASTSYQCVAAPVGSQIATRQDGLCRAQLSVTSPWGGWGWGGWGWGWTYRYCGDGRVDSPNTNGIMEECDGNNKLWYICTNQCRYSPVWTPTPTPVNPAKPKLNLPSCESIDPPSVNKGEYLPFWWELESDSNVNFVSSCSSAVAGKTNVIRWWSDKSNDPLCHFRMYVDDTAQTPAAEFSKYCYQDSDLQSYPLFQDFFSTRLESLKWYNRSKINWWSSFFGPSSWTDVPNKYGEYKLSLDSSTFYICEQITKTNGSKEWKQSTQRYQAKNDGWYVTECSFNFTVTTPYFVQQGKSLGTLDISQWIIDNFFSFDTKWSLIENIIQISNYQRTSNLTYLGQQFANKYTKLAGPYDANFRKVWGKDIYVKVGNGNLTIAGGDLPRGTIISNGGDITIQGDLKGKVMMIANGGTIYFESTNKDAVQQIEGIYIADNIKSLNQIFNNNLSKAWANKWWIKIKWIVISKDATDIEQIYSSRRSYLENWFKTDIGGSNNKKYAILEWAALTIETDPSFWTNLPPGANELVTVLETYK